MHEVMQVVRGRSKIQTQVSLIPSAVQSPNIIEHWVFQINSQDFGCPLGGNLKEER